MSTKAFIRVSTLLQDTEKNKIDILQFANRMKLGNVEFTEEHCSGRINYKERKLGALLDSMQSGDVLIVPELSRIARSIIIVFLSRLLHNRYNPLIYVVRVNIL